LKNKKSRQKTPPIFLNSQCHPSVTLLSEEALYQGITLAAHHTPNLAEGAGAACLMAAVKIRERLKGKTVAVQMSGANASPQEIEKAMALPAHRHSDTEPVIDSFFCFSVNQLTDIRIPPFYFLNEYPIPPCPLCGYCRVTAVLLKKIRRTPMNKEVQPGGRFSPFS